MEVNIKTKFDIGQEVYYIEDKESPRFTECENCKVHSINRNRNNFKVYKSLVNEIVLDGKRNSMYEGLNLSSEKLFLIYVLEGCGRGESELFATELEAQEFLNKKGV